MYFESTYFPVSMGGGGYREYGAQRLCLPQKISDSDPHAGEQPKFFCENNNCSQNFQDLKDVTHDVHYENYRLTCLGELRAQVEKALSIFLKLPRPENVE